MTHFPGPIHLPENVFQAREKRLKQIMSSAFLGVAIRFAIILFEMIGVYLFGSSALFMDALSSLLDVAATLFLIFCIRLAEKPPDEEHPFGHGRYEPLVGLLMGLVLAFIGTGLLFHQSIQLATVSVATVMDRRAFLIPLIALVLLEICYRAVLRTAKKENSPALLSDAVHYRVDGITSFFATIALGLAAYFPQWSNTFDYIGAIVIALFMVGLGAYAAIGNFHQLMDRIPSLEFFARVKKAALQVDGVRDTEKTRIQLYGPDAHVDIDIEVDPLLSVEKAHKISQQVRVEIQKEWPAVRDVTVHIEPYYPNDHT